MKKSKSPGKAYYLPDGTIIADRYRIDSVTGENGLTIEYKGYDTFRNKTVTIRELFPAAIVKRDPDNGERISCRKMYHENLFESMKEHIIKRAKKMIKMYPLERIANILTYLEESGTVYLIEEYVTGDTLEEHLKKRHSAKFTVEDLMQYLGPVMKELHKVHQAGMFHGAICPENIMVVSGKTTKLVGIGNPVEDAAAEVLFGTGALKDGYSPVELYMPEAPKGATADIYEMAAVFYRYVTGEPVPVYYDRINEEKEAKDPERMQTLSMKFQCEGIWKGIAVYDYERYQSMEELYQALYPSDFDFQDGRLQESVSGLTKPARFDYEAKQQKNYRLLAWVILLAAGILLVPKMYEIVKDIRINHFYDQFNQSSDYEQAQMLSGLSEKERELYTNDYADLDSALTDKEKSDALTVKYYDFQLDRYVTEEEVDLTKQYYEYMQIDLRNNGMAWINYLNYEGNIRKEINLEKQKDGSFAVITRTTDSKGNISEETSEVKP